MKAIDTKYDGRRKPRMALTRMEKVCFPELRNAMRRHTLLRAAGVDGWDPDRIAVRAQHLFTVGLRTYLNPKRSEA